jgi:hypothetical protein
VLRLLLRLASTYLLIDGDGGALIDGDGGALIDGDGGAPTSCFYL